MIWSMYDDRYTVYLKIHKIYDIFIHYLPRGIYDTTNTKRGKLERMID
jgi:hypothetical protein